MTDPLLPRDGPLIEKQKEVFEQCNRAKSDWLDGLMSKILPPELAFDAHSENPLVRAEVYNWMVENNIMLVEREDKTELVRDQTVLGELVISFEDGKVNVVAKEFLK